MKKLILIIIMMILSICAQDDNDSKGELICGVWYQGGQVLNGTYNYENDIDHYWLQKVFANVGFKKRINKWLAVTAALEAQMRLSFKNGSTFLESQFYSYDFYIDQARGDITAFQNRFIKLRFTLGYFHFHYNESTRNLGNILFKSSCYPTAIIQQEFDQNSFYQNFDQDDQNFDQEKGYDVPFLRLLGLNFNASFLNGLLFNDLMLTTHTYNYPPGDFSFTAIFGLNWRGIKACVGVQGDRILSVNKEHTYPADAEIEDPISLESERFTYKGGKFMTYASLDLKRIIFGEDYPSFFGEDDAKFFFEMNVLGLKNYNYLYENRKERIPIVFGVLLPTFNILDVLCIEFEHFGSLFPNSMERPINSNKPYPEFNYANYIPENYKYDDWKWSWYAKRSFSNFSIIFQFAHDHLWLWSMRAVDQVFRDNLVDINEDFYYQLKFLFHF